MFGCCTLCRCVKGLCAVAVLGHGVPGSFPGAGYKAPPAALRLRNENRMSHHSLHKSPSTKVESKHSTSPVNDTAGQPTIDRIRLRAYEISQARKDGPGDALSDWIQAEHEVLAGADAKR